MYSDALVNTIGQSICTERTEACADKTLADLQELTCSNQVTKMKNVYDIIDTDSQSPMHACADHRRD